MTILIGFTCKNGVVLASDSRISSPEYSTASRPDVQKIFDIKLANGAGAILAKAGSKSTTDYFHEIFSERALLIDPTKPGSVRDCAEICIKLTQEKILEPLRERGASLADMQQELRDCYGEMLLGYMDGETPNLYALNSTVRHPIRNYNPFQAMGCGALLAESVLKGYDLPKMNPKEAMVLGVYAVEFCKTNDCFCGGRTQVGAVGHSQNKTNLILVTDDVSAAIHEASQIVQAEIKIELTKRLIEAFKKVGIGN